MTWKPTKKELARLSPGGSFSRPKYSNRKVTHALHGKFDSQGELDHFLHLEHQQSLGRIRNLQRQVKYDFVYDGELIGWMKPDFQYEIQIGGQWVTIVEDYKSDPTATEAWNLRRRMLRAFHKLEIFIVSRPGTGHTDPRVGIEGESKCPKQARKSTRPKARSRQTVSMKLVA